MCSEAPDTSGMNAAAVQQAELSREQLDFFKQLYADTAPEREAAASRQNAISDAQLGLMNQQQQLTDEANTRYKGTFVPIEERIAREAMAYDTPERREQEAGQAMADVGSQVDLARAGVQRDLADRGVDASSGNAAVALSRMALGEGAAKAAAGNTARKQVETIGAAKLADAAAMGRGVMTNQGTTASLALNAGNASSGNAGTALNTATSGANLMQAGYQGAQQGLAGAASTYGNIGRIESQDSGGLLGGIGQLAMGAGAMGLKFSDENMKEDREPVSGELALRAVREMPQVESWRYKKGSAGDDGGRRHIGPMAQDVNRHMGNKAAPGGVLVDPTELVGITLAAVKAVDAKVDRALSLASTGRKHKESKHG
jgi:hypothetical protein